MEKKILFRENFISVIYKKKDCSFYLSSISNIIYLKVIIVDSYKLINLKISFLKLKYLTIKIII